jgi:hypothetical protein
MIEVINSISVSDTTFNSSTLQYMRKINITFPPEDVYFSKNMQEMNIGKVSDWDTASLLNAFLERLQILTSVLVIENDIYKTAKKCYDSFSKIEKGLYNLNASFAVNFLIDLEPRLSNGINKSDVLQLEIVSALLRSVRLIYFSLLK